MSILILEDILAVVLMVVLSTVAVSSNFEGGELVMSILKLVFFLTLWLLVGIYLIPLFLRKTRSLMNDETLLVVSLGLCFMMVVIAAKTGFSAAFGAFIMGSILAETLEAEHIERLVKPVKDLFGAIFFVSVGMMVDPAMIGKYWLPILLITLTVVVGQSFFATVGVLLSGQSLKTAVQSGFSLTQIGEFSFIIASLGVALGVTSDFLYPIVVAVSVITIFLTPYVIRLAEPAYNFLDKHLPSRVRTFLDGYAASALEPAAAKDSPWKTYLGSLGKTLLIYGILCVAICMIGFGLLQPLAEQYIPGIWAHVVLSVAILLSMAPFLRAILVKKNRSDEFKTLWAQNPANRAPLVAGIALRLVIVMGFIFYVLARLFHISVLLILVLALAVVTYLMFGRWAKNSAHKIEETFLTNLNSREKRAEYLGEKKPEYASRLLDKDMHLADFDIPSDAACAGSTLRDMKLSQRFGIQVVAIVRGNKRLNIPVADTRVFPYDHLQVVGADAGLVAFGEQLGKSTATLPEDFTDQEVILRRLPISEGSPFLGKSLKESSIRNRYRCLVVGVESQDGALHIPNVTLPFQDGDKVWIVGEKQDVEALMGV